MENQCGSIIIELDKEYYHEGIEIVLTVREKVILESRTRREVVSHMESMITHTQTISIANPDILNSGITRIPFSFSLPSDHPPSFNGTMGTIEYMPVAVMKHYQKEDIKFNRILPVVKSTRNIDSGFTTPEPW